MTIAPTPVDPSRAPHRLYVVLLSALVLLVATGVALYAWRGTSTSTTGTQGSGVPATEARHVAAFAAVDLAGANRVAVRVGGKRSVVVHADDNLVKLITTEVRNGVLVIGNTGSFTTKSPMRVDVTVPTLTTATLSGTGILNLDAVNGERFTARVPGTGVLRVSGTVDRLDATLGGSGDMQLENLVARAARVGVPGSGRLQVHATEMLKATVSGSGAIFYRGNPSSVTQSVTGSGVIIKQ
jgi:Putative auto-transporter adhesin, head GIN domain